MKRKKNSSALPTKTKGSKKNILVVSGIAIVFITIAVVSFMFLAQTFKTESYYILNSDIPAKQQITTASVTEITTAQGTAPQNSLSYSDIQQGNLYARYALYRGDVVSWSNSGPASDTTLGIPDNWAVTTFNVSSDDAVGGVVGRGDYIDILGVGEGASRYVFNNVLVLDVVTSSQEVTADEVTRIGETMQYTVGMPSEDIAVLHAAIAQYNGVKVIKAPVNASYRGRDTSGLGKTFTFGENVANKDLIEGSDPTFSPIARDDNGRPINEANCEAGLTSPEKLCTEAGFSFNVKGHQADENNVKVPDENNVKVPDENEPSEDQQDSQQ